jgi:uncharacterized membrane protein YfcA
MQSIPQLLSNIAYGAAIGGALGLTGTGGSILAVPALVYLVPARSTSCQTHLRWVHLLVGLFTLGSATGLIPIRFK